MHVDVFVSDDDEEIQHGVSLNTAVPDVESDEVDTYLVYLPLTHYLSYYKMKKILCWWLRVKDHLGRRVRCACPIAIIEMKEAEVVILSNLQASIYPEELKRLCEGPHVP